MDDAFEHSFAKKMKTIMYRNAFTPEQVNYLESLFKKNPYIESPKRKEVAYVLNVPDHVVRTWFQNRRSKEKKKTDEVKYKPDMFHQTNRNIIEFSNETYNDMPEILSANDYKFGLLDHCKPHTSSEDFTNKTVDHDPKATKELIEPKLSPKQNPLYIATSPVLNKSPNTIHKPAAEFSFDLYKKYMNDFIVSSQQPKKSDSGDTTSKLSIKEEKCEDCEYSSENVPEEFCTKIKSEPECDNRQRNTVPSNSVELPPLFVDHNPMIWNPTNVMPMTQPGPSTASATSNLPSTSSAPQEKSIPKRTCNCYRHVE